MGEFFKPLRRKIGVVTLAMALLLMCGWVRSNFFEDLAVFPTGGFALGCDSIDCFIIFGIIDDPTPGSLPPFPAWQSREFCTLDQMVARGTLKIYWQSHGFGAGEMYSNSPFKVWIVPYWPIVIPLTLLSAWLLLSTSRQKSATRKSPAS